MAGIEKKEMEHYKITVWKLCKGRYRLSKSAIRRAIIVIITATVLYALYCYQCREKIPLSRIQHLYVRSNIDSSVEDCTEPSLEISKANQVLNVRVPQRPSEVSTSSKQKLILLWTKYFGSDYSDDFCFFLQGNATFVFHKCPVSSCIATNNRSLISIADALVFHQSDFELDDLPTYRTANQIWIFYSLESPARIRNNWKKMNGLFNWTMSYREDSDIKVKYGEICRLPQSKQQSRKKNYVQNKTNEIVWFVSDCYANSNRGHYVDELSKYIGVDIYGRCGTKSCLPSGSKYCYEKVLRNYKFYLSFENSICQDYATEKLFNILNNDIIPIVMGGADYERIAPPNSYINIFNYPNPQKLSEYLKTVGGNSDLYNSYFEWKGKYKIYLLPWMCELCEKLHKFKDDGSSKVISNVLEWWFEKAHCATWYKGGYEFLNKCF